MGTERKIKYGISGENIAADYLLSQGHTILARNYRIREGEIDIIARKEETLYFIEVKHWVSTDPIHPLEVFTPVKLRRMRKAASDYLFRNRFLKDDFVSFCLIHINEKRELNFYLNLF